MTVVLCFGDDEGKLWKRDDSETAHRYGNTALLAGKRIVSLRTMLTRDECTVADRHVFYHTMAYKFHMEN